MSDVSKQAKSQPVAVADMTPEELAAFKKQAGEHLAMAMTGLKVFNTTMFEAGVPASAVVTAFGMNIADILGGLAVAEGTNQIVLCDVLNRVTTEIVTRSLSAFEFFTNEKVEREAQEAIAGAATSAAAANSEGKVGQ